MNPTFETIYSDVEDTFEERYAALVVAELTDDIEAFERAIAALIAPNKS